MRNKIDGNNKMNLNVDVNFEKCQNYICKIQLYKLLLCVNGSFDALRNF